MKVDTPLLVERRDRIARYLLANGKQRGKTLAAELSIPKSVVSGLLKHWSEQGHFKQHKGKLWTVTRLGHAPPEVIPEVVLPMTLWWHFCETWQPGDQVVEIIDD
jgi:hypothetical protein